jgi:hypothetical protein
MAQRIATTISLEGGQEIVRQLGQLAESGKRAFSDIKSAVDQTDMSRVTAQTQQLSSAMQNASSSASGMFSNISSAAGSIAGIVVKVAAVVGALALAAHSVGSALAKGAADTTSAISDQAEKLGLSAEALQRYRSRAEDAGVGTSRFESAVSKLRTTMDQANATGFARLSDSITEQTVKFGAGSASVVRFGDAAQASAGAAAEIARTLGISSQAAQNLVTKSIDASDSLRALGLSGRDIASGNMDQALQRIAQRIASMPNDTARAAAGVQMFGSNWRELLPLFAQGGEAMKTASDKARVFTDAEVSTGTAFRNALNDLGNAVGFTKDKIGLLFAPSATAQATWLTRLIDDSRRLLTEWVNLDEAGRSIFENANADTTIVQVIQFVRDVSNDLARIWTEVLVPAGKAIAELFRDLATTLNQAFGTNISSRVVGIVTVLALLAGTLGIVAAGALLVMATLRSFGLGASASAAGVSELGMASGTALGPVGGLARAIDNFKKSTIVSSIRSGLLQLLNELPGAVLTAIAVFGAFTIALNAVASGINSIFGTKLTATDLGMLLVIGMWTGAFATLAAILTSVSAALTIVITVAGVVAGALNLPVAAVLLLVAAFAALALAASKNWESIKAAVQTGVAAITESIKAFGQTAYNTLIQPFVDAYNKIADIMGKIAAFGSRGGQPSFSDTVAGPGAENPEGHAGGGFIRGAGTWTSDSILARLSNGEYVVKAAAVAALMRRYGSGIMSMINGGVLPPRFALGGLVGSVNLSMAGMPSFAAGGSVGAGLHPVTLMLPGGQGFGGLFATPNALDQIGQASSIKQVRSAGRSPSWVR